VAEIVGDAGRVIRKRVCLEGCDMEANETPNPIVVPASGQLVGGAPFNQILRAQPIKDGDGGDPKPPPPVGVSMPDYAFQFSQPGESGPECLNDADVNKVLEALRDPSRFGPTAEIRHACLANSSRIGIWLRPTGPGPESEARDRGVAGLSLLQDGEFFGIFISFSAIRSGAAAAFANAPKRFVLIDHNLVVDDNGAVHLTNLDVQLEPPGTVTTIISGFDEDALPDLDFQITIRDQLKAVGGGVQSKQGVQINLDTGLFQAILSGVLGVLSGGIPFLPGLVLTGLFFRLGAAGALGGFESRLGGQRDIPGVGASIAVNLSKEIFVPGGGKIDLFYTRATVTPIGLVFSGVPFPTERIPTVTISGPGDIGALSGGPAMEQFDLFFEDIYKPVIAWSAERGIVAAPNIPSTSISFDTGDAEVGTVITRLVTADVTDLDGGRTLHAPPLSVRIHVTSLDDTGLPPICRVKPWLPQCQ
jgi:hypothetical protein